MKQTTNLKGIYLFIYLFCLSGFLTAQQIKVSGTVIDESDGLPIVGVTVVEVSTNQGTITDMNGSFSLTVRNRDAELAFSFVGKRREVVRVGNLREFNIILRDEVNELQEIVAIGYGTMKKSDFTGAVSSLRSQSIEESKAASFTSALSGRIAGVSAIQSGGDPGAGIDIKIRGASSVSAGSVPLYVIDGVMMVNSASEMLGLDRRGGGSIDPMSSINPSDIESIEILKDASATAIYGSRGANGVVLITTKSGTRDGSVRVNFTTDIGFDFLPQKRIYSLSGSEYEDYMRMRNPLTSAMLNGSIPISDGARQWWNDDFTPKTTGKNTVWQDEIFQTGVSQNYNLSIRGSARNSASYVFSLGYYDKNGIVKTSNMNRLTYRANIENTFNRYIKLGLSLSGSIVKNTGVVSATTQNSDNIFVQMLTFKPNITADDITNNLEDTEDMGSNINNPVNNLMNVKQFSDARRTQGNAYIMITPNKDWTWRSTFGGNYTDAKSKNYYPSTTGAGRNDKGRVQHGMRRTTNALNENTLTFNKKINRDHEVTALGGITFQRITSDNLSIQTTNLVNESLGVENLKFGENIAYPNNYNGYSSLMSYLGRLNYNLYNRYLFTASFRADGSSKFSSGNKFSYFPSGAFAWKMNEEDFLRGVKDIDQLKFRISYGRTGNQSIGDLAALAMMDKVYYSYNTTQGNTGSPIQLTGFTPGTFGNSNLKWETTNQYNTGFDLMMWNGKLLLTAELYYKLTTDLLITEQLPGISGYVSVMRNVGSVENKGLEISLTTQNYKTRQLSWTTDWNITMNRNKVINIGSGDRIPVDPTAVIQGHYTDIFYVREGYPIGAMFGFVSDGLYQPKDFKQFYSNPDDPSTFMNDPAVQRQILEQVTNYTLMPGVTDRGDAVQPGFLKLKKLGPTGDELNPRINDIEDRAYLGSTEPLFFGGITNRFSFSGFELSLFLQYSYGNKLFNANSGMLQGRAQFNLLKDYYYNMWTVDNQDGTKQYFTDTNGRQITTDIQAEDASYLKVKEIVFSYRVPRAITSKLGIAGLRLNLTGSNLFTLTKYSWYEPEYSNSNALMSGLDRFSYPMSRVITGGVVVEL